MGKKLPTEMLEQQEGRLTKHDKALDEISATQITISGKPSIINSPMTYPFNCLTSQTLKETASTAESLQSSIMQNERSFKTTRKVNVLLNDQDKRSN